MSKEESCTKRYLFGAIDYARVGHLSILSLFGIKAYMRCGDVKWCLGYRWGDK